jgi:hypothetical protein
MPSEVGQPPILGIDPSVTANVMLLEAEVLMLQADLLRSRVHEEPATLRDLSPMGR